MRPVEMLIEELVERALLEFNPYHGPDGRFAASDGAGARVSERAKAMVREGHAKAVRAQEKAKEALKGLAGELARQRNAEGRARSAEDMARLYQRAAHAAALAGKDDQAAVLYQKVKDVLSGERQEQPTDRFREGLKTKVTTANGETLSARYRLVNADEITASHLERSESENPDYPGAVQNRAFNSDVVNHIARNLRPDDVLDPGYAAEAGPTVVSRVGDRMIAVGGNHRHMGIQRAMRENPEAYASYLAQLKEDAHRYGIKPEAVRPGDVLVREIEAPAEPKGMERLGRAMNDPRVTDYDTRGAAVTRGQFVSLETSGLLARQIDQHIEKAGDKATLDKMLSEPGAQSILHSLVKDGAIPRAKLTTYVKPDGSFTTEGKTAVKLAIVGSVIDDAKVIRGLPAGELNAVMSAIPHIVRAGETAPGLDAAAKVRRAARLVVDSAGQPIDQYLGQRKLSGELPDHPGDEIVSLGKKLRALGPRQFATYIKGTVDAASAPAGLFGPPPKQTFEVMALDRLLDQAIGRLLSMERMIDETVGRVVGRCLSADATRS